MALIEVKNLIKTYQTGEESFNALDGVSFSIDEGEFVAIMGTSGSGKSTCMNTLGTLDIPTSGEYRFEGIDVFSLSIDELSEIRNSTSSPPVSTKSPILISRVMRWSRMRWSMPL